MTEVPCLQLVKGVSQSLSTDGSSAMLMFQSENGPVAITVPVDQLRAFRAMFNDVIDKATAVHAEPGNISFKRPKGFSVGHSDQMRGFVAVTFDPNSAEESLFILADHDGLKLAEAIRNDVLGRMTAAQRAKVQIAMFQKKLIIPGQTQ